MKLQHVRTFVYVYQDRSFTAAANRAHATQSAVSMQIKELEESLGLKLFERSPAGVMPTPAGDRFYARALRLLREVEETRREMQAMQGQITGAITVGVMPTFAAAALAPAVSEFMRVWPYVNLKIVEAYSASLTEMVWRREVDFAIVPPPAADVRLTSRHVARDRELVVTSTKTKRRHLSPVCIAELGALKLIVPSRNNARHTRVMEYLASVGATVEAVIEMDAMMGTLDLIAHSDWVSILPATLCHPDLDGRRRKLHPLVRPSLSVDYVLISPPDSSLSAPAQGFADILIREIDRITRDWSRRLGYQNL